MCLICGFIGCFRVETAEKDMHLRNAGHSQEHYEESLHVYAMEMDTQTVWDFSRVSNRHLNL